jgi:uncharacterized protein YjiS (DUF1127 family)
MSSPTHVLSRAALGAVAAPRPASASGGGPIRRALDLLFEWRGRARDRRELARLDERSLRDIGLDRGAVVTECDKPFWRD